MEHEKDITLMAHFHHELEKKRVPKRKLALSNWQVGTITTSMDINSSPTRIFFISFKETTGSAVGTFEIKDGSGANDPVLCEVNLAAGASLNIPVGGDYGLLARKNLSINMIAGSIKGNIAGALEEDYQADVEQTEVMNFPGDPVEIDKQLGE